MPILRRLSSKSQQNQGMAPAKDFVASGPAPAIACRLQIQYESGLCRLRQNRYKRRPVVAAPRSCHTGWPAACHDKKGENRRFGSPLAAR